MYDYTHMCTCMNTHVRACTHIHTIPWCFLKSTMVTIFTTNGLMVFNPTHMSVLSFPHAFIHHTQTWVPPQARLWLLLI